jgi:uroporphyrinogen decarboxylase
VRLTGEDPGPGWVVQPQVVPLFEDYNIPRGFKHIVSQPENVPGIRHLYQGPDETARSWFADRLGKVKAFADDNGVAVQAWSAFGMDGVVWLTGVENAVMLAMDDPQAFGKLVDIVFEGDYARTKLALTTPGVDLIVQRGWYSSTDFWSPRLFDRFVYPHLAELTALTHQHGRKFAYVMTTGVERLAPRLADAGVDLLYFADPVQDRLSLEWARDHLADRMTLAGGTNALSLGSEDKGRIHNEVRYAVETLGATHRFILHPLDAIFPDTPWEGMEALIEAWKT